jgi:hypothetical protein
MTEPMNDAFQKLFPPSAEFSETDYLAFLSQRVPRELDKQLTHDAHPDLMMDEYVEVADLVRPLLRRSFPSDCASHSIAIFRLAGILEYTLSGYTIALSEDRNHDDPYKQIYIASFYLHCCLNGAITGRECVGALLVLVKAAKQLDLDGQFQVSRFIGSLVPIAPRANVSGPAPLSSILIALSVITAGIISSLSMLVEHAMREEDFAQDWKKEEQEFREGYPCLDSMKALRQLVSVSLGASDLQQIADRFREAGRPEETE